VFRSPLLADCLAIAAGGALGALMRFAFTRIAEAIPGGASPWGTLAANLVGCLAIGLLAGYVLAGGAIDQRHHLAIRTGVLGSLTTFSTFALESVQLAGEQRWVTATAYLIANLFVGLLLVCVGMMVGKSLAQSL
jgi:fluoride exporter